MRVGVGPPCPALAREVDREEGEAKQGVVHELENSVASIGGMKREARWGLTTTHRSRGL